MAAERNRSFEGRSSGSIVALMKPHTANEFGDGSPLSLNRVQPYVPDDPFPMPPINQRIDMDFPIEQGKEEENDKDYTYEEYDAEVSEEQHPPEFYAE